MRSRFISKVCGSKVNPFRCHGRKRRTAKSRKSTKWRSGLNDLLGFLNHFELEFSHVHNSKRPMH